MQVLLRGLCYLSLLMDLSILRKHLYMLRKAGSIILSAHCQWRIRLAIACLTEAAVEAEVTAAPSLPHKSS